MITHTRISFAQISARVTGLTDPSKPAWTPEKVKLTMRWKFGRGRYPAKIAAGGVEVDPRGNGWVWWDCRFRDLPAWLEPTVGDLLVVWARHKGLDARRVVGGAP